MAQSIRVSDDLYSMAQGASQALGRSLAQQMEYWAKLGAAIEAAGISSTAVMALLGTEAATQAFLQAALNLESNESSGLQLLKQKRQREAEEVETGQRSARSLWAFPEGALQSFVFRPSDKSEFDKPGSGW